MTLIWRLLSSLLALMTILFSCSVLAEKEVQEQDGVVTGEFTDNFDDHPFRDKAYELLQATTELTGAFLLQPVKGLNFLSRDVKDLTSTTWGLQATDTLSHVVVDGFEEVIVKATELEKDAWQIQVTSKSIVGAVIFILAYNAHTKDYNFLAQTHRDTVALYTANSALGLFTEAYSHMISQNLSHYVGMQRGWSAALAETITAAVMGATIGVIAHRQERDITVADFKKLPNLMLALAVGNAVKHGGIGISHSVKQLMLKADMSEEWADRAGKLVNAGVFGMAVTLITRCGLNKDNSWKNYIGKVTGDMTKYMGVMISTQAIHPTLSYLQNSSVWLDSVLDRVDSYLPSALQRVTGALRAPVIRLSGHLIIAGGVLYMTNLIHDRKFDLAFGYWLGVGGLIMQDFRSTFTNRTWPEHYMIWAAMLAANGGYYWLSYRYKMLKAKTE